MNHATLIKKETKRKVYLNKDSFVAALNAFVQSLASPPQVYNESSRDRTEEEGRAAIKCLILLL